MPLSCPVFLCQYHVETNHDYFMAESTIPWFEALVWLELLFQVPFFAFATAGFVRKWNAVRIPCIIYGSSAFTSVVPIMGDILASDKLTDPQRYKLMGICESKSRLLSCKMSEATDWLGERLGEFTRRRESYPNVSMFPISLEASG